MNTKSGIFTRGFATRKNTAFLSFGKIQIDLTLKKSNILYVFFQQFERLSLAYKELLQGKGQDDFNETLLMGTSISRTGCISSGTLGGFVSLPKGDIGFLTCAHVIGIEDTGTYVFGETNRVFVSQPSDGRICAEYKDRQ